MSSYEDIRDVHLNLTTLIALRSKLKKRVRDEDPDYRGFKCEKKINEYACKACEESSSKQISDHNIKYLNRFPLQCPESSNEEKVKRVRNKFSKLQTDKGYECVQCAKFFATRQSYRTHQRKEHDNERFVCDLCGKVLTEIASLRNHRRTHSGEKPFMCEDCGKNFSSKKLLRTHERVHSGEKPNKCPTCDKRFAQRAALNTHMKYHSGVRPHVCSICQKGFITRTLLKNHLKKHGVTVNLSSDEKCFLHLSDNLNIEELEENYICDICSCIFRKKEDFLGHNWNACGNIFRCCRCNVPFNTLNELHRHAHNHKIEEADEEIEEIVLNYDGQLVSIPKQNLVDSDELLYVLDDSQCVNEVVVEDQASYQQRRELSKNVEVVRLDHGYMLQNTEQEEEGKSFETSVVKTSNKKNDGTSKQRANILKKRHELPDFTSTNYIYIQANEEIDIPHYKCLRCEQLFINKFVFFRHIEKGKCYINNCDVCSATFAKNSDFYLHYTVFHTDRAVCNFCFRTFMYEKNVKEHMLRHLDQFRHRCEECNKGFYTVREYRNHYKNRHMGIRHKCEFCSRTFADEYYFKRHIATHSNSNIIVEFDVSPGE
ncbi:hypothetical protein WA026_013749 [Henosepilachna vigintioctopunctata]|uniref:C2H2-type domain-containing protein n=1 Tax=Henosepilachna vigintioctopunctata TaxID=420089 RepID=A0AAW1URW7_9CUCU